MSTVASTPTTQHASWCDLTQEDAAGHACISNGHDLEAINAETGSEWGSLHVALTRRPHEGATVDVSDFVDAHGVEQELRLRPGQARSLAAALVRLADVAELGR